MPGINPNEYEKRNERELTVVLAEELEGGVGVGEVGPHGLRGWAWVGGRCWGKLGLGHELEQEAGWAQELEEEQGRPELAGREARAGRGTGGVARGAEALGNRARLGQEAAGDGG